MVKMDYHLLFMTATPTPTVAAKTFEAIMNNAIREYEMEFFWWAMRLALYYILMRETFYTFIPWCLWSLKGYIESFFPAPLVGMARAAVDAAEDVAEDLLEETEEGIEEAIGQVGAMCGNPALGEEGKTKKK